MENDFIKEASQGDPSLDEEVIYPSTSTTQTHVDQLRTKATLFGMQPAPAEHCRVLELGCADGTNLIAMALTLPKSDFVGIDLAQAAIDRGLSALQAIGLQNLHLRCGDLSEVDGSDGVFDYIIVQGVYSWVSQETRHRILSICQERLAPQGVAFVSYNTYPGGHLRDMIREMMLYHTAPFSDPNQRVQEGVALVRFLSQAGAEPGPVQQVVQGELDRLLARSKRAVLHDDLAPVNAPIYFHHFCAMATDHGLQYLGEADYVHMPESNLPTEVAEALRPLVRDRILREQYLDFFSFRTYRQSLLCRAGLPLQLAVNPELISQFMISCPARPQPSEVHVGCRTAVTFVGQEGARLTVGTPLIKAALLVLSEHWPAALPFSELLASASARLHQDPSDPAVAQEALELKRFFLASYAPGLVRLHLRVAPSGTGGENRPAASPLVRWQLREGQTVTNLFHQRLTIDSTIDQQLLRLMDGTRDRPALLRELNEVLVDRTSPVELDELTQHLRRLGKFGLLTAGVEL